MVCDSHESRDDMIEKPEMKNVRKSVYTFHLQNLQ